MHRYGLMFLLVLLLALPEVEAAGGIVVRVTKGAGDAQPIGIVPFGVETRNGSPARLPLDVAEVVAADLERSGRFKPLPREDMLERPTRGDDIQFQNWRVLGTDNVLVGKVIVEAERYIIQFQLFDVFRGDQLLGFSLPVAKDKLRRGAHVVADKVFEALTGVRGAFSTRIAFVTAVKDGDVTRYQLVVADADGENQRTVLRSVKPIMSPAWSPDGRKLAYVSFENDAAEIYVQELATGSRKVVSSRPGINGAPSFSPSGRMLAVTLSSEAGNPDIWLIDLEDGRTRRITRHAAIDTEPSWTADESAVLFTSDRGGSPQIYRVELRDRYNAKRVTFEGNYNASPSLTPDGKLLTMVTQANGQFRIAVMDMESKAVRILTDGGLDESPSIAPNGSMIIYATQAGRQGILAATSTDGRVQQQLALQVGDVREPAWSPYPPGER
ncbi:MAG: Tol-Pal system beta propeller repeat protein TolB [Gammaproteobacteria bacterium]|nr:Tol-Pal system beta propeller repeat protein TolB [Gammaproteobacteria bacterium]